MWPLLAMMRSRSLRLEGVWSSVSVSEDMAPSSPRRASTALELPSHATVSCAHVAAATACQKAAPEGREGMRFEAGQSMCCMIHGVFTLFLLSSETTAVQPLVSVLIRLSSSASATLARPAFCQKPR